MSRIAEIPRGAATFHVVRGDRYACGAKRLEDAVELSVHAHQVATTRRCLRIGCVNDYAKADKEARS